MAVLWSAVCFAQEYHDVVYLQNGSIVKGMIVEQVPNQQLKIQSGDNTFVYSFDEIEKISKGLKRDLKGQQNGIYGLTEVGVGLGFGDFDAHSLKLNAIAAYRINPYFSAGIGTGIRYYFQKGYGLSRNPFLPVLGDFRMNFIQNHISPYVALTGGYSFDLVEGFEPFGLMLNPSVGVSVQVTNRLLMNFGLGYDIQSLTLIIPYVSHYQWVNSFGTWVPVSYGVREVNETIHAISLNVGLSFFQEFKRDYIPVSK